MDPNQIKKIQSMNRYKKNKFLDNLYFYSLTALICSFFCCVTLCLPYLSSFLVYMSSLIPLLLSSKLLFILCNIIIFVLMINSKILSSDSSTNSDVYYDEYIQSSQSQTTKPHIQTFEVNKVKTFEKHVEENIMNMFEKHVGQNTMDLKRKVWIKETTKTMEAKEEGDDLDGGYEKQSNLVGCSDELNKRAEDFIARVNRHREFELIRMQNGCY
ncbi:uncharacterized protein LOC123915998 [Trifolium pratense]|uniref:uncharacterized protein LOC123915998 n=1 Tax=Trifolium pratense TaxID=57577 RepID=UPI001E694C31|nr:uncharacterized protein LOC123915998 [Trifolium pratense]